MECAIDNEAKRTYQWRMGGAMAVYVVFLFTAVLTFRHGHPSGALVYVLAVLPALPILAALVFAGIYLAAEKDEFERTVMVQSILWAMGGVLGLTTVWGFLEMFAPVDHLQPFWLFPLFWMLVGVSTPLIRWRYR